MLPLFASGKLGVIALAAVLTATPPVRPALGFVVPSQAGHKVYGTVQSLSGTTLVIRTRMGHLLTVDGRSARSAVLLTRNRAIIVFGTIDPSGVMHARSVWRTIPDAAHWPPDR